MDNSDVVRLANQVLTFFSSSREDEPNLGAAQISLGLID